MAREKEFRFKQFAVSNHLSAMKVGTDGVLLGAWCDVDTSSTVLDVGTGTGLIALMIAQRYGDAHVTAIDIEPEAIGECQINFAASPWYDRLEAKLCDFKHMPIGTYSTIVSNPPYFQNSLTCPDRGRTTARHTGSLDYATLITRSAEMLVDGGLLNLVAPSSEEKLILDLASTNDLNVKRITRVLPKVDSEPKRILVTLVKSAQSTQLTEDELVIELSRHEYSNEYKELTRAFYLNM